METHIPSYGFAIWPSFHTIQVLINRIWTHVKQSRSKIIAQLFFALLLLIAQGQLLIHQTDLDAHADQSACEVCIHMSYLGHAVSGEATTVPVVSVLDDYFVLQNSTTHIRSFYTLSQPRAPPLSSLI